MRAGAPTGARRARKRTMPTYVYECQRCGHRFELLQGIKDPPRQRCPRCRGKVKRLLAPGGGLIFRGSGFYATDYKRKERRPAEAKADPPDPAPAKGNEGPEKSGGKRGKS